MSQENEIKTAAEKAIFAYFENRVGENVFNAMEALRAALRASPEVTGQETGGDVAMAKAVLLYMNRTGRTCITWGEAAVLAQPTKKGGEHGHERTSADLEPGAAHPPKHAADEATPETDGALLIWNLDGPGMSNALKTHSLGVGGDSGMRAARITAQRPAPPSIPPLQERRNEAQEIRPC